MANAQAEALIRAVMGDDNLFSRDEALAILRSIRVDDPDEMPHAVAQVTAWARRTRSRATILELILKLGSARVIAVRPAADEDDIEIALDVEPDQIEIRP